MKIEVLSSADVHAITSVEIRSKRESIPDLVETNQIDEESRIHRWKTYFAGTSPSSSEPERIVLGAMDANTLIGYIAGHHTSRFGMDMEIQSFYVLKQWQRKSVGTDLLLRFSAWANEKGYTSTCVGVSPLNPYRSFYLKFGATERNQHWLEWKDLPGSLHGA